MKKARKREPELFLNRELSWLEFNGRVLEEACDATNPPLERLKFACIVASNLDEFFMVRVAALKNALAEGDTAPDVAGLTPAQQLQRISERAHPMVEQLYEALSIQAKLEARNKPYKFLGQVLIELGYLSEKQVLEVLNEIHAAEKVRESVP